MKTKLVMALLIVGFISGNGMGIAAGDQSSDDPIIKMLTNFYTGYLTEISRIPEDADKIEWIKKEYCTADLLNKLNEQELDYDPFTNAQDIDNNLLKNLIINKDTESDNLYAVSYPDSYSKNQIIIKLKVIKENDSYKIDDIL